jgi:hypothetical protein
MDELQRQMRAVALSVAGGARAPGPTAARQRGRQRRRRLLAGQIMAVMLVAAVVPVAIRLDVPSGSNSVPPSTTAEAPRDPFSPLTDARYAAQLPNQNRRVGPIAVVASGERQGARWRLVAYPTSNDEGDSPTCISYEHEGLGETRGCDASSDLAWYVHSSSGGSVVAGTASSEATTVRLRLTDGTVHDTPTIEAASVPQRAKIGGVEAQGSFEFAVKFFAFVLPFDVDGRMASLELVDRGKTMCVERVPGPYCRYTSAYSDR